MLRFFFLLIVAFAISHFSTAQVTSNTDVGASELDFYLLQAFQAGSVADRPPLNHIGIQVEETGAGFLVTAVLEDYPAHRAGIHRGDIIESIDDQPYHPVFSFNDRDAVTRGFDSDERAYRVDLRRGSAVIAVTVQPIFENLYDSYRTATMNSIQEFSTGNKVIGYVRFWSLSRTTNDLISYQAILSQLDHCDGLIFDLRNSYGYLDLMHLDLVFPNRSSFFEIVSADGWLAGLSSSFKSTNLDSFRKPIAVLLNSATRGGPELFAYQLDKLERVVTIGEATPGMLGKHEVELGAESPTLQYVPANDVSIDGKQFENRGVAPEQPVDYPFEQNTRSDPQYEAALSTLLGII